MRISVVNLTHGLLPDLEIISAIRAVNRQIQEDFAPYWNLHGQLRLEGNSSDQPEVDNPEDMQGEAIIYLWDKSNVPEALGYHEANYRGIPYGFIFVDIATEIGESWTVTFSHEVLELIGDGQANKLIRGPHPRDRNKTVYHWHEMCDAVQSETYKIDGIEVSNFVLPLYFTEGAEAGSRNDFIGTKYRESARGPSISLRSFGINPGGYVGFFDPELNDFDTVLGADMDEMHRVDYLHSKNAAKRQKRKNKARMARRGNRYATMGAEDESTPQGVSRRIKQKLSIRGCNLTIRCLTDDLVVQTDVPALKLNTRQGRGYFAHDIYANAQTVDEELTQSDFEEIAALEIEPVEKQVSGKIPEAEIGIQHNVDEAVIALIDVEGVLFWQQADTTNRRSSVFKIRLQAIGKDQRSRRGFLLSGTKTLVRFIRHKLVDNVRQWITGNLSEYLAETIEKLAFKKRKSATLDQFRLLDEPKNKKVGDITPLRGKLQSDKRYLLFVHGIFSSTKGAFGDILLNRWSDDLLVKLSKEYDKIIGFDHWTVARSTLENATELFEMLPGSCRIDIVCHSRGAGVTRCLLEHPNLAPKLKANKIKIGKVIFVAGACQGSELANPERIGALVNVFSALSSLSGSYLPLKLFTGLLKAVEYGVKNFPGIHSMSPQSQILKELNKPINQPDCEYIYSRSNYEPSGKLKSMLDEIGIDRYMFRGEFNDGVVPFLGAGTFDEQITNTIAVTAGPEYGITQKEHVYHTAFFEQEAVRQSLIYHLTKG
ncbi:MAG TPA: hypothetical protein VI566_09615 [Xanthomonadales bacterium]|nr:hypothetical protein [Xanthomonadales bacterium]